MNTTTPTIKKVFTAAGTLRDMNIGQSLIIPTNKIKTQTLRKAASDLKKNEGMLFTVTEAKRVNETLVIRTK